MAPQVGLEPTTLRLTAGCSAIELLRSIVPALGTEPPDPLHLDHIKASQRLKAVLTLRQLAGFHCAEDARKSKELHVRNTRF